MTLSRIKNWTAEVLTATDLNAEFNNVLNFLNATPYDLSGGQIKFPATQNPSSDPNTFDDYEEGIWSPVVSGAGTAGTFTYTLQTGSYVKKGKEVSFVGRVAWSSYSGPVGGVLISLPMAAQTKTSESTLVHLVGDGITFDAGYTQSLGLIVSAASTISLYETGSNKTTSPNGIANVAAAGAFYFSGTYYAAT